MAKPTIDKKFIVKLQGKDFVTYEGLLDLAHQMGLKGISTEILQLPNIDNESICIVKAIARVEEGEYHGIGDAGPSSVNRMIAPHIIRMAETRAKARALRDLTNVGMTAFEELGGEEETPTTNSKKQSKKVDKDKQAIADNSLATDPQLNLIYKLVKEKNYGPESMASYIKKSYGKDSSKELTKKEASELIEMLNGM